MTSEARCHCPYLKIDNNVTNARNWDPDCPTHGLKSEWYRSPEQVERREAERLRLTALYELARKRRNQARGEYQWTPEDQAELDAFKAQ